MLSRVDFLLPEGPSGDKFALIREADMPFRTSRRRAQSRRTGEGHGPGGAQDKREDVRFSTLSFPVWAARTIARTGDATTHLRWRLDMAEAVLNAVDASGRHYGTGLPMIAGERHLPLVRRAVDSDSTAATRRPAWKALHQGCEDFDTIESSPSGGQARVQRPLRQRSPRRGPSLPTWRR